MKFAICNETFQEWPFEKACAFAAECGYTGIEIAPFTFASYATDITAQKRREIRRQAEAAGLEVVGLHWLLARTDGFHLTSPNADVRRKTADYFKELARLCADLGGKVMVLGSPQQRNLLPEVTLEEANRHAEEVIRGFTPVLEQTGVTLALEPLGPKETSFLVYADEAVDLAAAIDCAQVGLHLDVKAMAMERAAIPEVIKAHAGMLVHFHANDANLQGPGFGETDFVPIFAALKEIGYDRWVSVEVFDYTPGPERLARESIRYMERCLAEVPEA
jgi:sugar phosphate isomerase/epimerase